MARYLLLFLTLSGALRAQETGWRDPVELDVVRVWIRKAPLFSKSVLDAARKGRPFKEALRVVFAKPGWFLFSPVAAGTYTLDVEGAGPDLQLTLRDAAGAVKGFEGFWINPSTDTEPTVVLSRSDAAVVVTIQCDNIKLPYRFISQEAHRAVARGAEVRAVRVIVTSDTGRPETAAALAREADRAVDVYAELLGRPAPQGPFRIFLFGDQKAYQAADRLVTGGDYQRNDGMASSLTMQAYIWDVTHRREASLPDAGATLTTRATVIHEIGHLVAYASSSGSKAWPSWLSEGLAEEGTRRALGKEGDVFHAQKAAKWRLAERTGNVPVLDDLLFHYAGSDLNGWYAGAYFLARRVTAGEKPFRDLLEKLDSERLQSRSALVVREALETRAVGAWREIRAELTKADIPPAGVYGHLDPTPEGWRLSTRADAQGRALMPDQACRAKCVLEGSFSWEPVGIRQADFYLAYAGGRQSAQFLKVAILPKLLVLYRFYDDRWEEWGRRDLDSELGQGDGKSRAWHAVKIDLDVPAKRLSVSLDGAKPETFELLTYVPTEDSWAGFGAYDSIVHFKDVRVRP